MTNYYSSGLYLEPFFTKHRIDLDRMYNCMDDISYNFTLLSNYYRDGIEDEQDEDEIRAIVDERFFEALSYWTIYFEPIIFNEKAALECDLIPFIFENINLLALAGCGMDLSPKLDAYQALTDNTIDKGSRLFTDNGYFEHVVGSSLAEKVKQVISYDVSINMSNKGVRVTL